MNIPESYLESVKAIDGERVVELIASCMPLDKRDFGCCPFHGEKTPSFHVNRQKGYWKCFGCNRGGDIIAFWTEFHRMGFAEAVVDIGKRVGLGEPISAEEEIRKNGISSYVKKRVASAKKKKAAPQKQVIDGKTIVGDPMIPYERITAHSVLPEIVEGYLERRKITRAQAQDWGFGYQLSYCKKILVDGEAKEQWFINRLIMPVFFRGRVVYFQARSMDDRGQKYINPRGFDKTQHVYEVERAGANGVAAVAEGILSARGLDMALGDAAVGVCMFGKYPTGIQHAKMVKAGVRRVIFFMDPDAMALTFRENRVTKSTMLEKVFGPAEHFYGSVWIAVMTSGDPWDNPEGAKEAFDNAIPVRSYAARWKLWRKR